MTLNVSDLEWPNYIKLRCVWMEYVVAFGSTCMKINEDHRERVSNDSGLLELRFSVRNLSHLTYLLP